MIATMDTEALETFVAVHREQGFSRAARVLNRTQPAISRRISLLEHELGAPLFERVTGESFSARPAECSCPMPSEHWRR